MSANKFVCEKYKLETAAEDSTNNKMHLCILVGLSLYLHKCNSHIFDAFTKPQIIVWEYQTVVTADHPRQTMEYFVPGEHLA